MTVLKRINQDDLRNHNLSVVLNTMLRSTSAFSRADLAKETGLTKATMSLLVSMLLGLTKATMSLLVSMLLSHHIVKEGAPLVQSVYGRPSTPLSIAGGSVCGIGIQINTDGYGYVVLDLDGSVVAERWIARDLHDPSTPLSIAGGSVCGIGIQINTDGYGYVVLDLDGSVVAERWIARDLHDADADALFDELDTMLIEQEKTLRAQNYMIAGVGLALPGLVTEDGHLLMARNLGWEDLDLSRFDLVRRFDVVVANESNMAAVAQLPGYATQRTDEGIVGPNGSFLYVSTDIGIGGAIVRGGRVVTGDPVAQLPGYATQRTDEGIVGPNGSFLYVSTDIGIGGAIVRGGRVVTGDHGFAGEIGHLSVQMDGPVCRCGRRGCVEAYAGRRSMVEAAGVAEGNAAVSQEALDEFGRRVQEGDPVATAVFADAGHAMTSMLTSVINLADLDTVIIGGSWSRVPADVLARMAARIAVFADAGHAMTSMLTSVINLADLDTVIIGGSWSRVPADVLARMAARIQERILARGTLNVRLLRASGISRPALFGAAQTGLRNFIDDPLRYLG